MISNKLYLLNTELLSDNEVFEKWYRKIPSERRARIDAIKAEGAKRLCLGAGILIHIVMAELGIDDYEIETAEHGKPYIKVPGEDEETGRPGAGSQAPDAETCTRDSIFFNVSHSGTMAVLALSDREVGVDIQIVRHFKKSLIDHVFNEDDFLLAEIMERSTSSVVMSCDPGDASTSSDTRNAMAYSASGATDIMFRSADADLHSLKTSIASTSSDEALLFSDMVYTRLWTFKESAMKYTGLGLRMMPENIHFSLPSSTSDLSVHNGAQFRITASCDSADLSGACDAFDLSGISFTEYEVPGYALTVCSEYAPFSDAIQYVGL